MPKILAKLVEVGGSGGGPAADVPVGDRASPQELFRIGGASGSCRDPPPAAAIAGFSGLLLSGFRAKKAAAAVCWCGEPTRPTWEMT